MRMPTRQSTGFTLIELMVAVAIAAILASIAWPAYQKSVQRSRRADAMSALAVVAQAQERWRGNNNSYKDSLTDLEAGSGVSNGGHYDIAMVADSVDRISYTATATARSSSAQSNDTQCRVFKMRLSNGSFTYSSLNSGSAVNAEPDPCWVK